MKKSILLFSSILLSVGLGFGQSVTITPNEATAQGVNAEIEIKKVKTNSVDGAKLTGFRSRLSGGADAAPTSGQELMIIDAKGFADLNGFRSGGIMKFEAAEKWTAGAIGTNFRLSLGENDNGISYQERLTIKSTGDVGIGSTNPAAKLDIGNKSTNDDYPSIRLIHIADGFNRIKFETLGKPRNFVIASKIESDPEDSRLHLYAGSVGNVLSITGDGNIINNGFTQLGADASDVPKIKMKKIRGVTGTGATRVVAHGLDVRKIIAVDIFIEKASPSFETYPPSGNGLASSGDRFRYWFDNVNINMEDIGANLRGKFYRILITYEE